MLMVLIKFWIRQFKVCTNDIVDPLQSFQSLSGFFNRRINMDNRYIPDKSLKDVIYSPSDSVLTQVAIFNDSKAKIKGLDFTLKQILKKQVLGNYAYCVFYLSPGDFHDFVSFNDFISQEYTHIQGDLMPVNNIFTHKVTHLLALQERVVVEGSFHGRKAFYVPVGALNVGNITMSKVNIQTNQFTQSLKQQCSNQYKTGETIGQFKLGSTVVIIFELFEGENIKIINNGKVMIGQKCIEIVME
eukprot:EST47276.1 Phosphatidylserine decarboxylase proenzyme [Spironucleus salmonicida]